MPSNLIMRYYQEPCNAMGFGAVEVSNRLECLQAFEEVEHLQVKKIPFSKNLLFASSAVIIYPFGGTDAQMSLPHLFFDERAFRSRALRHVMDQIESGKIKGLEDPYNRQAYPETGLDS